MAEDRRAERVAVGRKMLEKFKKKNKDVLQSSRKNSLEDTGGSLTKEQNLDSTPPQYSELFGSSAHSVNVNHSEQAVISNNQECNTQFGSPVYSANANDFEFAAKSNIQENRNLPFDSNIKSAESSKTVSATPQVLFNSPRPPTVKQNSAADFFDNIPSKHKMTSFIQPTFPVNQQEDVVVNKTQNSVVNPVTLFQSSSTEPSSSKSTPSSIQTAYPLQNTPELFDQITSSHAMNEMDITFQESEIKILEEQERSKQLEEKLKEYKIDMNRLEETLTRIQKEKDTKIAALEEKLELHCKTLEILVGEKTELQSSLSRSQEESQVKLGEIEELQNRLKASRHRVYDLEREINHMKAQHQQFEKSEKHTKDTTSALNTELIVIRKQLEEREEEIVDLRGQLDGKGKNLVALEQELTEKQSQLALAQLRVQQLSSVDGTSTSEIDHLQQDKLQLEQRVIELDKLVNNVKTQSEEASREYQQYINSLNSQLQNLSIKNEELNNRLNDSVARNQQLIQHVSELEKQLQNQNRIRAPAPPPPQVDPTLQKQVADLQEENNQLEERLQEQIAHCEKLKASLDNKSECIEKLETTLDMLDSEKLDAVSLQAAIESDKVAASRAMAQNNSLKKQLQELQDAFVKLSNNKLELTEKLEHEQHLSKDLSERLAQLQTHNHEACHNGVDEVERSQQTDTTVMFTSSVQTIESSNPNRSQPSVSAEAMTKLEEKFRKTMQDLAELSDEKQRLEHLVEQLQYETDTIGEYVALYQTQRGLLQQRALEKDEQVTKLAQEREALRQKLAQLNCLVQGLLDGKPHQHQNGYDQNPPEEATEVVENVQYLEKTEGNPSKVETAGKIMALLSDITSNKLVTVQGLPDQNINFHPCPWCSGRLITV